MSDRPGRHRRRTSRLVPAAAAAAAVAVVVTGILVGQAATGPATTAAETITRTTPATPTAPETTTAAATAGTYEPGSPELRRYLAVLDQRGLDLSRDERWVAVQLATAQCLSGGFVAGRQAEIRAEVQAALPRLDRGQDEVVVDCVVEVCGMLADARVPE